MFKQKKSKAFYMKGKVKMRERPFIIKTPGIMKIAVFKGGVEKPFDPIQSIADSDGLNYTAFFDADYGVQLNLEDITKGMGEETKKAISKVLHAQNVLYAEKANAKIFEEKKKPKLFDNPWIAVIVVSLFLMIGMIAFANAFGNLKHVDIVTTCVVSPSGHVISTSPPQTINMTQGSTQFLGLDTIYNAVVQSFGTFGSTFHI
jgi:hypothetical protein